MLLDKVKYILKQIDSPICNHILNDYRFINRKYQNLIEIYKEKTLKFNDRNIRHTYQSILKNKNVLSMRYEPHEVGFGEVEINSNCNLNCVMCNTQLSKRKQNNMNLDLFERILDEFKRIKKTSFSIHSIGEPLINPLLEDYFKIAKKYKIPINLSTNGQVLDEKIDLICRYHEIIDSIRFSVDGAVKETYEKIRKPGKFEKLVENLTLFKSVNHDGKYIKNVYMGSIANMDTLKELAYHLHFYSQFIPMKNIALTLMNGKSPDNSYFFDRSLMKRHIVPLAPCDQLNGAMHFLNDGSISVCSVDYYGDLVIGNFNENKPEEIINSEKAVELRRQHNERKIPENHYCATCFGIDKKVVEYFFLFQKVLVLRNSDRWDVEKMQRKFDQFFVLFDNEIPDEDKFLELFK